MSCKVLLSVGRHVIHISFDLFISKFSDYIGSYYHFVDTYETITLTSYANRHSVESVSSATSCSMKLDKLLCFLWAWMHPFILHHPH